MPTFGKQTSFKMAIAFLFVVFRQTVVDVWGTSGCQICYLELPRCFLILLTTTAVTSSTFHPFSLFSPCLWLHVDVTALAQKNTSSPHLMALCYKHTSLTFVVSPPCALFFIFLPSPTSARCSVAGVFKAPGWERRITRGCLCERKVNGRPLNMYRESGEERWGGGSMAARSFQAVLFLKMTLGFPTCPAFVLFLGLRGRRAPAFVCFRCLFVFGCMLASALWFKLFKHSSYKKAAGLFVLSCGSCLLALWVQWCN